MITDVQVTFKGVDIPEHGVSEHSPSGIYFKLNPTSGRIDFVHKSGILVSLRNKDRDYKFICTYNFDVPKGKWKRITDFIYKCLVRVGLGI